MRKTKTDKKDALTIAQFLMQEKETLSVKAPDHLTSLKGDMKRILSVIFPELEHITGVFTKATIRLLMKYPSAHTIRKADPSAIADVFKCKGRGNRPRATIKALIDAAASSVGVASPAKELTLRQEVSLLMHVEEQMKERPQKCS